MRGEGFGADPTHDIGPHLMDVGGQLEQPVELGRPGVIGEGNRLILSTGSHGIGHPIASSDSNAVSGGLLRFGHGQFGTGVGRIVEVEITQLGQAVGELLAQQAVAGQLDPSTGGPGNQCRRTGRGARGPIGGDHIGAERLGSFRIQHLVIEVQLGPTVIAVGQINTDLDTAIGTVRAHRPEQAVEGVGVVGGVGGLHRRH